MDPYADTIREFFRLLGRLWLERLEAELWNFAQALDQWLHELFLHPTPAWRERFEAFLAEQAGEGRVPTPESRDALIGLPRKLGRHGVEPRAGSQARSISGARRRNFAGPQVSRHSAPPGKPPLHGRNVGALQSAIRCVR